jgi:hypothetical protein
MAIAPGDILEIDAEAAVVMSNKDDARRWWYPSKRYKVP